MRTYLVMPDDANGGSDWEMIVRALTPQEAVEVCSEHEAFGLRTAVFSPIEADRADGACWVVRELPFMLNERGVIPWDKAPVTFFVMGEHEDANLPQEVTDELPVPCGG